MGTDFFDDDLLKPSAKNEEPLKPVEPAPVASTPASAPVAHPPLLNKMGRQKEEISGQVAGAIHEIEVLRRKQEDLEREKAALEELTRKQTEYEKGKRDILDKLVRATVALDRNQEQTTRMLEVLSETRGKFKATLEELNQIDEETWGDSRFESELSRALALVENAQAEYKKSMARIAATGGPQPEPVPSLAVTAPEPPAAGSGGMHPFSYWLKVGCAMTLPLIVVMVVIFMAYLYFVGVI